MPRGEYALFDGGRETGVESFTSAPGPMGWRYFATIQSLDHPSATRVDISVDAAGRPVRVRIAARGHELLIAARGGALWALHDGAEVALDAGLGTGFAFPSPGFLAVALHAADGPRDETVIAIDPETLATRPAPRALAPLDHGPVSTPAGVFDARRWLVDEREVAIADAVVVEAAGLAELRSYERGATGPAPRLHPV